MDKSFGSFLLTRRIKQNLSQQEIADILGYTSQTISNFERDKAFPDLSIWSKYAETLNVDLSSFIMAKEAKINNLCSSLKFDKDKFAKNLKYLRKKNNLTQKDLAKLIQVNNKTIMSYENGKSFPSLSSFIKLCNLYKLKADELYFVIKLDDSNARNKPIKKKRIFVPIVLPIIIVTSVSAVGVGVATATMRNRQKNNDNETSIYSSNNSLISDSSYDSFSSDVSISSNDNLSNSEITSSSDINNSSTEPSNIDETNITYNLVGDILTITDIDTSLTDIVVPTYINDHKVNKIDASMITSLEAYQNKTLKRLIFANDIEIDNFEDISFNNFGLLENITLPINIDRVSSYQFNDCHLLKEIDIPLNVKTIEGFAFSGCSNIKAINIHSSILETIGYASFQYCNKLEDINIPNSVTLIDEWAFQECNALKEITLPTELLKLSNCAIYHCINIDEIIIPNKVNTIGVNCFQYCSALTAIYIPLSVSYIDHDAFTDCPNLTIYCASSEKPEAWHDDWNSENNPIIWGYTL